MKEILEFINENYGKLSWALMGLVWVIVRLTPSEKDDQILQFIETVLNFLIPDRKKKKRNRSFNDDNL